MSKLAENLQYFRSYAELLFGSRPKTPDDAADYCMSGTIRTIQVRAELAEFARLVADAAPKRSMEIGTKNGGTLFLLCTFSPLDAQIISLDLPEGEFGGGYRKMRIPLYHCLSKSNQRLHLVRADSHLPGTKDRILRILSGGQLDILFIDGDHTYTGVKRDFEMYSPLVRSGGIILFHNIVEHPPEAGCDVATFWNEIKQRYRHREFIADPKQGWAGLGILLIP